MMGLSFKLCTTPNQSSIIMSFRSSYYHMSIEMTVDAFHITNIWYYSVCISFLFNSFCEILRDQLKLYCDFVVCAQSVVIVVEFMLIWNDFDFDFLKISY